MQTDLDHLIPKFIKKMGCDTARISKYDSYFLIIGYNRNTKDNAYHFWSQNGKKIDFDYIEEHTIASGKNKKELTESFNNYIKLTKIDKHLTCKSQKRALNLFKKIADLLKK